MYDPITDSLITNIHELHFIPNGKLIELMTTESIGSELQRSGCCPQDQTSKDNLTQFILLRAKKCFATLVMIDKVQEIKSFYQNELGDSYIPVTFEIENGKCVAAKSLESQSSTAAAECPVSKTFLERWERRSLDLFSEKQWLFLAPIFEENDRKRCFPPRCPLPFVQLQTPAITRETLFSQVHQRSIHCDHISGFGRDPENQNHYLVAVKELRQQTGSNIIRTTFEETDAESSVREEESLETIKQLKHPHLIKTIATFEWRGQHYFVFPWAENGNLREFWESSNLLMHLPWVMGQLEGLCDALQQLHAKNLRHGDLKPENILCFQDSKTEPGVLVIADVGLLRVQSVHTNMRNAPTRTMTGTWFYCPPQDKGSPRSRLYDVWSMGGIILEVLICILYGPGEVRRLHATIERFYQGEGIAGARVHPEVERWISHMYQDPRCGTAANPTAIRLLLDLVRKRLLVIAIGYEQGASLVQTLVENEPPRSDEQFFVPELTISSDSAYDVASQEIKPRRADSSELYRTVKAIRERCISPGTTVLPLIHPSDMRKSYPGPPRASSDSKLTVPSTPNVSMAREPPRSSAFVNLIVPRLDTENSND